MEVETKTSGSSSSGSQPHKKKPKLLHNEADLGEQYLSPTQPGRVPLDRIGWRPQNRGGQVIMPMHVQAVAKEISQKGTSKPRCGAVRLVVVPENQKVA